MGNRMEQSSSGSSHQSDSRGRTMGGKFRKESESRKADYRSGESTRECNVDLNADITVQSVQKMKRKESGKPDKKEESPLDGVF